MATMDERFFTARIEGAAARPPSDLFEAAYERIAAEVCAVYRDATALEYAGVARATLDAERIAAENLNASEAMLVLGEQHEELAHELYLRSVAYAMLAIELQSLGVDKQEEPK